MRYIFVDEAGTSAPEPVTVVVGLIANADEDIIDAENLFYDVIGGIPEELKDDFCFHAVDVYQNRDNDHFWSFADRRALLRSVLEIPQRIGMSISVSVTAKYKLKVQVPEVMGTPSEAIHTLTFTRCIAIADEFIRKNCGHKEVATVVAEDVPSMRSKLKGIPLTLRKNPISFQNKETGSHAQFRVTKIRNSIHFVDKSEDPLVQIADALAFSFRRYFADLKHGKEFIDCIMDDSPFKTELEELKNKNNQEAVSGDWTISHSPINK